MRRTAAIVGIVVAGTLAACSSGQSAESSDLSSALAEGKRVQLQAEIGQGFDKLITDGDLPYVLTKNPEFQDATAADVAGSGLPAGTSLSVYMKNPVATVAHPYTKDLVLYGPLRLLAEAVRPHVDEMDFVVVYLVFWQSGDVFVIDPEDLRLYLNGDISDRQLSQKMSIYGP
jgi:hypothetical protein